VVGQGDPVPNDHAAAAAGNRRDQPLVDQLSHRQAGGVSRDPVVLHQLWLGRKMLTRCYVASNDLLAQLGGDSTVEGGHQATFPQRSHRHLTHRPEFTVSLRATTQPNKRLVRFQRYSTCSAFERRGDAMDPQTAGQAARDLDQVNRALHHAGRALEGFDALRAALALRDSIDYSPLRTLIEQGQANAARVQHTLRAAAGTAD